MVDVDLLILAASPPALTTLYWICLIVGGGLLLVGVVAGHHGDVGTDAGVGMDMDVSVHADVGADVATDAHFDGGHPDGGHPHAGALAGWLSVQFVVFFMAMFGLVGVVLTHLTQQTWGMGLTYALIAGLVVGQGVHQVLRKLRQSCCDSTPQAEDYVDKPARVTVTVQGSRQGEVALYVGRAERFIPAVAKRSDQTFSPGQQVGVVAYRDGVGEIVSREEYEFLKKSD